MMVSHIIMDMNGDSKCEIDGLGATLIIEAPGSSLVIYQYVVV